MPADVTTQSPAESLPPDVGGGTITAALPAFLPAEPTPASAEPAPDLPAWLAVFDGTRRIRWPVLWPLVLLLVFSGVFRWTSLDVSISRCFYDAEAQRWPWYDSSVCKWFYRRGMYPAWGLGVAACVWLAWGLYHRRTWRSVQPSVYLLVVLLVGPGLIVNQLFKQSWGRPRPHQITAFRGSYAFVPVGTPGTLTQHNSSFPSGHAAVAFYLITPAFLVAQEHRRLARGLMTLGLLYGLWMGGIRVIQGGHFLSDVVWSGAIVYFTAAFCALVLLRPGLSADDSCWSAISRGNSSSRPRRAVSEHRV